MTAATVIVPTHDAASTLDLAVGSALVQTVGDLEVVIVGDGVTPAVRSVVESLLAEDDRVRFLDRPKGEHHGERHRDEAVRAAAGAVVCYLCDDDLLLPDHVETMIGLLADHDLAQSLNGHLDPSGEFHPYFGDLGAERHRRWLAQPHFNTVSVTGTAHTAACYRRLPDDGGWAPPPPGRWTDHVMWQQLLALPGIRAVTSDRLTALQLPTSDGDRHTWSGAARREELQRWLTLVGTPGGRRELDDLVRRGLNARGAELQEELLVQAALLADEAATRAERDAEVDRLRAALDEARRELDTRAVRLARIGRSWAWAVHAALRRSPLRHHSRRRWRRPGAGSPP